MKREGVKPSPTIRGERTALGLIIFSAVERAMPAIAGMIAGMTRSYGQNNIDASSLMAGATNAQIPSRAFTEGRISYPAISPFLLP